MLLSVSSWFASPLPLLFTFPLVACIYLVYPWSQLLKLIMNVKIFCNLSAASKQSYMINILLICRPFDSITLLILIALLQIILKKFQRPVTCPGQTVVSVAIGFGCIPHDSMVKTLLAWFTKVLHDFFNSHNS